MGSIFELTFFKVYFSGPCDQPLPQGLNFEVLDNVDYMKPSAVHGVIWAYLMLSFFWLISSVTLITSKMTDSSKDKEWIVNELINYLSGVRLKYVRYANVFLFSWIILASLISILDLSFGILFGLDYGVFMVGLQTFLNLIILIPISF